MPTRSAAWYSRRASASRSTGGGLLSVSIVDVWGREGRPGSDEREILDQRRGKPGHLLALRRAGDTDLRAVEGFFHLSWNANLLEQLAHEQFTLVIPHHRPRRGGVHDHRARRRGDGGKSLGNSTETPLEGISPRRVHNGDLDPRAPGVHFGQHRVEAEPVTPQVGFDPDLPIGRDHIGLPGRLNSISAEKKHGSRPGLYLAVEAVDGAAHRLLGEVLAGIHLEADPPQLLGKGAHVFDRIPQRGFRIRISRIADDQRHPPVGLLGANFLHADQRQHAQDNGKDET